MATDEHDGPPKLGRGGWPLVPSEAFPGELALACPECGSQAVSMGGIHPHRGTGPGGRGRLGDPGAWEINDCVDCGHSSRWAAKP